MNIKIFDGNNLPHELLLTIRQKTNLRNAFENNMSTDIKLSKAQIPKIIQCGKFLGSLLSKLAGSLMKVVFLWQKLFELLQELQLLLQQLMQEFKKRKKYMVLELLL